MRKTFKREVAIIQLFLHSLLVGIICWQILTDPAAKVDSLIDLALGMAIWVYGFAGGAFGLDSLAKQINPPQEESFE